MFQPDGVKPTNKHEDQSDQSKETTIEQALMNFGKILEWHKADPKLIEQINTLIKKLGENANPEELISLKNEILTSVSSLQKDLNFNGESPELDEQLSALAQTLKAQL
ncbi:MAG: hypothetical protein PHT51_02880 [Patescibacteria group bacterium]|nr:hypothetical protein [Patescibacteria group bacterium]MDD4610805.1 hypothetical protein [Patescibacteria group bacterium]